MEDRSVDGNWGEEMDISLETFRSEFSGEISGEGVDPAELVWHDHPDVSPEV